MKKFLSSLLLLLTVLITASPVYADGESISSVTVVGATEQSGTPTPTNPVNIVTNNGVVKLNNFRGNIPSVLQNGVSRIDSLALDPNKTYTLSCFVSADFSSDSNFIFSLRKGGVGRTNITGADLTAKAGTFYTRTFTDMDLVRFDNSYQIQSGQLSMFQITDNTVYTEGVAETIADSANHTATVETLFAVGDYADEQNINTGVVTHKVGVKVLDGTENWSTAYVSNMYCMRLVGVLSSATSAILHSNYFEGIDEIPSAPNNREGKVTRLNDRVCVGANSLGALDAFKSWLATQYANGTPVIIVYPLATETTENVTAQTMATAPVIQNNGTIATTIRTLLQNGQTLVSNSLELGIKIATNAYNDAQFAPVETALNTAVSTIKDVVSNTITQTTAIAQIASDKQTRPDSGCPAGKTCLLVEDADGTPHWYEIIEEYIPPLPSGYTQLTYIESTGTQYIDTGIVPTEYTKIVLKIGRKTNWVSGALSGIAGNGLVGLRWESRDRFRCGFGTGGWISTNIVQQDTNDIVFTKDMTKFNETIVGEGKGNGYGEIPLYLFAYNLEGTAIGGSNIIYYATVYNSDTIVFNGIPAKRDSDNEIGMYDTVTNTFFTNQGTGTFTVGPVAQ